MFNMLVLLMVATLVIGWLQQTPDIAQQISVSEKCSLLVRVQQTLLSLHGRFIIMFQWLELN